MMVEFDIFWIAALMDRPRSANTMVLAEQLDQKSGSVELK
jgi:hypothetical protein